MGSYLWKIRHDSYYNQTRESIGERASHDTEIEQQDGRFQTAQGPAMTPTEGLGSGG